jgi:hypothetical protein
LHHTRHTIQAGDKEVLPRDAARRETTLIEVVKASGWRATQCDWTKMIGRNSCCGIAEIQCHAENRIRPHRPAGDVVEYPAAEGGDPCMYGIRRFRPPSLVDCDAPSARDLCVHQGVGAAGSLI